SLFLVLCSTYILFPVRYVDHRSLHSFPTRRSSDLRGDVHHAVWDPERLQQLLLDREQPLELALRLLGLDEREHLDLVEPEESEGDRKSTRLNSSHGSISYAVFCLKKKNKAETTRQQ